MAFVNGYLTIMSLQKDAPRIKMAAHLQDMMEDGEIFGWPLVKVYHVVWFQHLNQGRVTWNDEATRLKLCRALVWHRIAPSPQASATPATNTPRLPPEPPCARAPSVPQLYLETLQTYRSVLQDKGSNTKTGQGGLKQLIPLTAWITLPNRLLDPPAGRMRCGYLP